MDTPITTTTHATAGSLPSFFRVSTSQVKQLANHNQLFINKCLLPFLSSPLSPPRYGPHLPPSRPFASLPLLSIHPSTLHFHLLLSPLSPFADQLLVTIIILRPSLPFLLNVVHQQSQTYAYTQRCYVSNRSPFCPTFLLFRQSVAYLFYFPSPCAQQQTPISHYHPSLTRFSNALRL